MGTPITRNTKMSKFEKDNAKRVDSIIEIIFGSNGIPDAILHGGIVPWRIFDSHRISFDIDIYSSEENIEGFIESIRRAGMEVTKDKRTNTGHTTYLRMNEWTENGHYEVDMSISKTPVNAEWEPITGEIALYKKADGSTIEVVALGPMAMLNEKISAYYDRKKITDLYDIYYIASKVLTHEDFEKDRESLNRLMDLAVIARKEAEKKSAWEEDEKLSKVVAIENVPTSKKMVDEIERVVKLGGLLRKQ